MPTALVRPAAPYRRSPDRARPRAGVPAHGQRPTLAVAHRVKELVHQVAQTAIIRRRRCAGRRSTTGSGWLGGADLGRDLAGGVGIVAFIAPFASLIGMRFAARWSRDLTL